MKRMKNNLDERQERQLLRIEGRGCWIAYWTLLISIFVQQGLFGVAEWKSVAGEWIVFMILCIYLVSGCLKNGIWDRHLKADSRTNLYVSAAAGVVFAVIFGVISYLNYNNWPGALATALFAGGLAAIGSMAALSAAAAVYKKRLRELEEDEE